MKIITPVNQVSEVPIKMVTYNTFWKRFKGFMFRIEPIINEGILIEPCNSIHMFFMFFAIDVVFINENNEIVYVKSNVKPWTVIFPIKNANAVLELPAGTISSYEFRVGDIIEL